MSFNCKTVGNKVIVESNISNVQERQTAGGLVLPGTSVEFQTEGVVLQVGPEVKNIKCGDIVHFPYRSERDVRIISGTSTLVFTEPQIDAVEERNNQYGRS